VLTDAAITTLARSGMRGLTHRAVDQTAGLPEGSTSYYFRTREALLSATLERLAELSTAELAAAPDMDAMAGLLHHWVTGARDRMLARFELTLEATRRPALHATLERAGALFRTMAETMLTEAGVPDPEIRAADLVAHVDGLIFDQVASVGPPRTKAQIRASLDALLASAARP
jgi:AcrR family transcriptional regulator